MIVLTTVLFLASSGAFLLGLKNPKLVWMPTRKHSSLVYSSSAIAWMIITMTIATAPKDTTQSTQPTNSTEQTNTTSEPTNSNSGKQSKADTESKDSHSENPKLEDKKAKTNSGNNSPDYSIDEEIEKPKQNTPNYEKGANWEADSLQMCKQFVRNRLESPSSADFYVFNTQFNHLDNGVFRVVGQLDAQNKYGAEIRLNYDCKVQHIKEDEWELVNLDLN